MYQNTIGKKSLQTEILPQPLATALDSLQLKGVKRATAIQICSRILALQHRHKLTCEDYIQIASTYLEKIDPQYGRVLKVLTAENITQIYQNENGTTYSTAKHQAKAYRVNPELISSDIQEVEYETKRFKTRNLNAREEAWILQDLQSLRIDAQKAQDELQDYLEYLDLREWEVTQRSYEYQQNQQLTTVRFGTHATEYKYKAQYLLDIFLKQPEQEGKKLYRQGEHYCIDTQQAFKRRKVESVRKRYGQALLSLQKQLFYATRSITNSRVHHTLTETPTFLLEFITVNGEILEELDVCNSQLACLAHVMLHGDVLGNAGIEFPHLDLTGQSRAFVEACQAGSIYQNFANHVQASRSVAKTELFRVCFGGLQINLPAWKTLVTHYAPVAAWLQAVKKSVMTTGEKFNLAQYLQRVEAWIMMENIYPALKSAGLVALSKHDSFLVPKLEFDAAKAILETEFERLGYLAMVKNKVTPAVATPFEVTPMIEFISPAETRVKSATEFLEKMKSSTTKEDEDFFAMLDSLAVSNPVIEDALW
ncbi:hypothetical protein K3G63_06720 [Hymenobacter sp. HSC-4F20]|uniref:hypothetical protein n=1 Tax=Hymenobacter sp. HSC-4F20 TaxID=2864135 RepID=UPI001C72DA01|nr:hypothetical protein [Hymenobacter sp. HSC-4F20]MBX0290124.1 hypothetical protein [Hymenobacter sp. HSC-4F20]